jgi:peptide chain release factor 2
MVDPKAENALRDAVGTLDELETRWSAARDYLKIDDNQQRHEELRVEAADPHLWDNQDRAREVTTELGRLANDLAAFDELRKALDDGLRAGGLFSRGALGGRGRLVPA